MKLRTINSVNLQVGIRRIKKISKGGILLEVSQESDIAILEVEVNSNKALKEKYRIKKGEKMRPILYYIILQKIFRMRK